MPTATWPMPAHESSHVRSAQRERSYEGIEHPAKPSAATRSRPRAASIATRLRRARAQTPVLIRRCRCASGWSRGPGLARAAGLAFRERAEHPGHLLVVLHQAREEVAGARVVG